MCPFDPYSPVSADFRDSINARISSFLDNERRGIDAIGTELSPVLDAARDYTGGGKRLRPAFCYWGHVAAAGQPVAPSGLLQAAGSLEFLHVSALVHDDLIDHSNTRRGLPSAHRRFEAAHVTAHGDGSAEQFGFDVAILLGDLLLMWSSQMFTSAPVEADRLAAAIPLFDAMRTEVTCGQVLDVTSQSGMAGSDSESALDLVGRVVEYKCASYTVVRPSQIGVALAGGSSRLQQTMADFGSPIGRAFQYRDDLLGVFGDAELTGKPAGDDLREGKRTVLVAHALNQADSGDAARLKSLLGRPDLDDDDVAIARRIIETSGARDAVESTIEQCHDRAVAALDDAEMTDAGRVALRELAHQCVERDF
ncbi:polyprenyl synthetase family protein [Propionibacterium sp. NM47_B9-13]|jgi:geranylgeranyl diphosphate synthase type I|uniref:Geranylgeranyl pyrophosphate synthase n=2 Tax=Cutibacterium modestum TaxID=2559073 RepID=A0AAD1NWB2_9ACTN|nr:polyprenyl synthetase family protein [Cutibacterium modestum]TGY27607.1 polyprenyl synthetase family protein [Propionibacterium sp. NM47_B9-13]AOH44594.1 geranylgeranyl pyrophosphate synthase [Cutibacterium modestum]EFS75199.1 polyprenyl synthetase [Cutibacterium modestum HL037PA2]EFS93134.1 polyprenyl synthetase [Cutibacterium modestum HL044PA1]EFT15790.1 polyprenyl synthetase [Cutibacterium modestum HL037PA3]